MYNTCFFSWEALFPLEGLQCGVYEGRNSIPWWESVHALTVKKHFSSGRFTVWSLWGKELYSLLIKCICSFNWEAFFPLEGLQYGVYEGRNSILRWESVHVLSVETVEKHFSLWKVYSVESMRKGTLFPGERVYKVHVISHACASLSWNHFFPRECLHCRVYEGRNSIPWWESVQCTCNYLMLLYL